MASSSRPDNLNGDAAQYLYMKNRKLHQKDVNIEHYTQKRGNVLKPISDVEFLLRVQTPLIKHHRNCRIPLQHFQIALVCDSERSSSTFLLSVISPQPDK